MRCQWQAYLNILPLWLRPMVDKLGKETLQELRIRIDAKPELICGQGRLYADRPAKTEDVQYIINTASQYSPWSAATMAQGYLTAPGGHRIGVCGIASVSNGIMCGIRNPTSLCIRVARDFPGIAEGIPCNKRSVLIIGSPGSGKTTLLRDLIRHISCSEGAQITVVDEKGEIFPFIRDKSVFPHVGHVDILCGCSKPEGIEAALRNMGPAYIAVDEITAERDCAALLHAGWCGVRLLATAHAGSLEDLYTRPVYAPLIKYNLFELIVVLQSDKTFRIERCAICSAK